MKVFIYTILLFVSLLGLIACVVNLERSDDFQLFAGIMAVVSFLLYEKVSIEIKKDPDYNDKQ